MLHVTSAQCIARDLNAIAPDHSNVGDSLRGSEETGTIFNSIIVRVEW